MTRVEADKRWKEWRDRLSVSTRPQALEEIAIDVRAQLLSTRNIQKEWMDLPIRIGIRPLTASGGHGLHQGIRWVFVSETEPWQRQRFTVAHELCHFLLQELDLPWLDDLEAACDRFAQHVLLPPAEVEDVLNGRRVDSPADVLAICSHFGVSISMGVRGLSRFREPNTALIGARYRGHRCRPAEIAFRVETSAAPAHLFVPIGQRLSSLGLEELAELGETAPPRSTLSGEELWFGLPVRGNSAHWGHHRFAGPVNWESVVLGGDPRLLLVAVDVSRLRPGKSAPALLVT